MKEKRKKGKKGYQFSVRISDVVLEHIINAYKNQGFVSLAEFVRYLIMKEVSCGGSELEGDHSEIGNDQ